MKCAEEKINKFYVRNLRIGRLSMKHVCQTSVGAAVIDDHYDVRTNHFLLSLPPRKMATLSAPSIEREIAFLSEGDETQDEFERRMSRYSTGELQMQYYKLRWLGMGGPHHPAYGILEKLLTARRALSA